MHFDSKKAMEDTILKLSKTSREIGVAFPHSEHDGKYDNMPLHWWTNGFWGGIMWLLYDETKDEFYKETAEAIENILDEPLYDYYHLHHDVGFMWLLTSGYNYKFTKNESSRRRLLHTANLLAGRFNIKGNFIRAWNDDDWAEPNTGWAIIDCMMNIPLLFWASNELGDPRYRHIAMAHCDTVLKNFIDDDGSVRHICSFDPNTGEFIEALGGQGYSPKSAWSRGASWAIYGFAMAYGFTKEERYLDASKKVCRFFMDNLNDDYVPCWDFRAPNKEITDTSAAACAASGMIELAKYVDDGEYYKDCAKRILNSLYKNYSNMNNDSQAVLNGATGHFPGNVNVMVGLIYGDYYFIEALKKLNDKSFKLPCNNINI